MFKTSKPCSILLYTLCLIIKLKRPRLYIKQHFSHPPVNQSVATFYSADGLYAKQTFLTVFTSIAAYYFI